MPRAWRSRLTTPYAAEREHSAEHADAHAGSCDVRAARCDAEQVDAMGDPGRAAGG